METTMLDQRDRGAQKESEMMKKQTKSEILSLTMVQITLFQSVAKGN